MSTTDESSQDQKFFNLFMIVIGALISVTVVLIFVARAIAADTQLAWVKEDPAYTLAIDERIKPVGFVALPGDEPAGGAVAVVAADAAAPVAAKLSGEQVYNTACFACHGAGVGGAPKLGDPLGSRNGIVVQRRDPFPLSHRNASVATLGETEILPRRNQGH